MICEFVTSFKLLSVKKVSKEFINSSMGEFLGIQPSELKFPFELRRQSSCSVQLSNRTDQYIAFKVKTTNPKRYCVRPNAGVVLPNSLVNVTVTMQAQKEIPPDLQCRDKFLIQSVIAPNGATSKDVTPELFNKEMGKKVDEFRLRVVFIPANPPSPVPEGDEEGNSSRTSSVEEDENKNSAFSEAVARSLNQSIGNSSSTEASIISRLNEDKAAAIKQNQKLIEELALVRKQSRHGKYNVISIFWVLSGLILGVLVGYFYTK